MNLLSSVSQFQQLKQLITRFMMTYKFALDEMETKIEILKEEFQMLHDYNPIEHTKSRLKSPESIMNKLVRKNLDISLPSIKENIRDIAGLRITCSFIKDIYLISDMLQRQSDLKVLEVKDYIKQPKPNGYQSLHMLIEVPVFLSDRVERVCIEVQIRTIAMDFWASLEHKIFYKYNAAVPDSLVQELKAAAESVTALDRQMERLHREMGEIKADNVIDAEEQLKLLQIDNQQFNIPIALLEMIGDKSDN
ncbi:GTP pyrophosphokinase family protein [Paenibacillus glycanilyticus]|uniref:GTP pyrophosphokinase n=1 Tax=Paenibacillus glycanilyticus TaxID=126569 RepID=UPI00203F725A|nr:GTP pyrophosphokinase family protein [Paenibacillus glycanilyticus]MCM3627934.1 GTP pyrophosphokinase family protein [Paenibacillus glycanilyticus]